MDPARTAVYTLSLHDALPILLVVAGAELKSERRSKSLSRPWPSTGAAVAAPSRVAVLRTPIVRMNRSEEHTSELQSLRHLVCSLSREKKNQTRSHSRAVSTE